MKLDLFTFGMIRNIRIFIRKSGLVLMTKSLCSFQQYFNYDVTLPVDQVRELALIVTRHINMALTLAKSAIMLEDAMKSIKFAGGCFF